MAPPFWHKRLPAQAPRLPAQTPCSADAQWVPCNFLW